MGASQKGFVATHRMVWILVACLTLLTACHTKQGQILGKAPEGEPRNIVAVRSGDTPAQVTLKGVMTEKCPAAGCWFYLQDETGTIKVDTKSAGFVVVDVPLQTKMTVSGKVVSTADEVTIDASGLRY